MSPLPLRNDCQTTVTLPAASETARALKSLNTAVVKRWGFETLPASEIVAAYKS